MAIYDNNGTASAEISKLYDNNGTANTQIGKVYDNNGTANSLIYTASTVIIPNPTDYPASAFVTSQNSTSSTRTLTVDASKMYMSVTGKDDHWYQATLTFATNGHKYLNITYSATSTYKWYRTLFQIKDTSGNKISTVVDKQNEDANISSATAKIDVSAYSKVSIFVYLYVPENKTRTFTITNCELTDD